MVRGNILFLLAVVRLCMGLEAPSDWKVFLQLQDDYVNLSYSKNGGVPTQFSYIVNSTVPTTGRHFTMYVGVLQNSLPQLFSLELPPEGEDIHLCFVVYKPYKI